MAYYDFLNVVFAPLLKLDSLLAVFILSLLISFIIILITKFVTDQALMKRLKDEIKDYQKQMKEHKSNPSKVLEIQKKAMEVNMKYMTHSLKPTLVTFIPIILIFGWMSANFAYNGISSGQEFTITAFFEKDSIGAAQLTVPEELSVLGNSTQKIADGKATWALKGDEGDYIAIIKYQNQQEEKRVFISDSGKYAEPSKKAKGPIKLMQVDYQPKKIFNLFGWKLGWLGTYIIFSIIFTMALRKLMKVY